MRNLMLLLIATVAASCVSPTSGGEGQTKNAATVKSGLVPTGTLGVPLGQLVLLEGARPEGPKTGVCTLKVEKVDGKALTSPVSIRVDNVDLPKDARCVLRGYETMRMIGSPPAYEQFARLKDEPPPNMPQAAWQTFCSFVALEAVEPKSLEIKKPGADPPAIGRLGVPLGQLVLLEGARAEGPKTGVRTFKIEKIDGKALTSPVSIRVDNVDLPKDARCVLRGYETIRMIGSPPAYEQFARLKDEPPPNVPQAAWQIFSSFVALEAVEPKSLEINKPGKA
jgi:hypothetical protein